MSPKPDVSAERKQQIFQAALLTFGKKGYHLTTMDDIAAASGLSKGAVYWYFKGKKELFLALFQEVMDQFEQTWEEIVAAEERTATEKLLVSLDLFREELGQMAPFFGVMIEGWAQTRHDEDVEDLMGEFYQPYLAIMNRIIAEGAVSGEFQVDDVEGTALAIMSLFDGITLAVGTGIIDFDWDRLVDAAAALALQGLGVSDGRNR